MEFLGVRSRFCGIIFGRQCEGMLRQWLFNTHNWKEPSGFYLGYMNDYPDNWTQGETLDELERMLVSLRRDIETDPELCAGRRDQGVLRFA